MMKIEIVEMDEFEEYRARAYSNSAFNRNDFRLENLYGTPRRVSADRLSRMGSWKSSSRRTSGDGASDTCVLSSLKGQSPVSGTDSLWDTKCPVAARNRVYSISACSATPPPRNKRCSSFRRAGKPGEFDCGEIRPRTLSMPSRNCVRPENARAVSGKEFEITAGEDGGAYRVRSFSITSKGIVNQGDAIKLKSTSSQASIESGGGSTGTAEDFRTRTCSITSQGSTVGSATSSTAEPPVFRVLMLGAPGVGKTALTQQFMTSEYMGNVDTYIDDEDERAVSVLLDGEESTLLFLDTQVDQLRDQFRETNVDAYVLVYSATDRESFCHTVDHLYDLRVAEAQAAVILVANKGDIVRGRQISEEEGRSMAMQYNCKYIEVSAVLNHRVDDLLVGILSQIRLSKKRKLQERSTLCTSLSEENNCVQKAAKGIFSRLFKRNTYMFRSCDNLLIL